MMPLFGQLRSASSGAHGYLVVTTTVSGSGAVTSLIAVLMNSQPPFVALDWSIENLTSAGVIGSPLWNFPPLRSLNVQVRLSADIWKLSASHGRTLWPSGVISTRFSYICWYTH